MQTANLDMIVRRTLLERSLPIHWYSEVLFHTSAAIRELSKDTLKIVNSVNLPIDSAYAANLPMDFVDDIGVYIPVGDLLHPIPKKDSITPLRNRNSNGDFIPFTDTTATENTALFGINPTWIWYWNVSDYGEPTGRYFGANGGDHRSGYKIFKERRQIQMTETFAGDSVVLLYISNGQSIDNATQVDWMAFRAIQSYADWQRSPNAAFKDSPEARTYYNEKRLLRANLNDLTTADIRQIIREHYTATIKN